MASSTSSDSNSDALTMASDERPSLSKIWLLAIRPQTLPASVTPVIVGCALAHADGARNHGEAFLFWLFALAIQIGTNLHNDYADFVRGADTKVRGAWLERLRPRQTIDDFHHLPTASS